MKNQKLLSLNLNLGVLIVFAFACAPKRSRENSAPAVSEQEYCGTVRSIVDGITLRGHADYQYLKPAVVSGAAKLTLNTGNVPFEKPIRKAEVRVLSEVDNVVVQCGETDSDGNFQVIVPRSTSTQSLRVEVNSRGFNDNIKASVLDKAESKTFYSIGASVSLGANSTIIDVPRLVAPAKVSDESLFKNLEGGAFHIFDMILSTNQYLVSHTTESNCTLCTAFVVNNKVTVYWIKGFNPASYFNETSPLSFFDSSASLSEAPSLYILGGSNGDYNDSDTDHFDDSVIIHEYGHFLEKHYWRTDSPGGVHNGNLIIDPRLAFSEGFANFLPSAVLGSNYYIDTMGSPYGSSPTGFKIDLENEPNPSNPGKDKIITNDPIGEGVYRELSVSRALLDYIDSDGDKTFSSLSPFAADSTDETANINFAYIWLALTNNVFGLNASSQHFVSMGHFNKALYEGIKRSYTDPAPQWVKLDSARLGEFQVKDTSQYAAPLVASTGSCAKDMFPVPERTSIEGYVYSDLFLSSDFYQFDHPGGELKLQLNYTVNSARTVDLNLYLYKESHDISDEKDLVGQSQNPSGNESISVTLAAGTYMVLVNGIVDDKTYTSGLKASYDLISGGRYLCGNQ